MAYGSPMLIQRPVNWLLNASAWSYKMMQHPSIEYKIVGAATYVINPAEVAAFAAGFPEPINVSGIAINFGVNWILENQSH